MKTPSNPESKRQSRQERYAARAARTSAECAARKQRIANAHTKGVESAHEPLGDAEILAIAARYHSEKLAENRKKLAHECARLNLEEKAQRAEVEAPVEDTPTADAFTTDAFWLQNTGGLDDVYNWGCFADCTLLYGEPINF